MNLAYPLALEGFLSGSIDLTSDTVKAVLCDDTYVYSAAHNALDDVGGGARIATTAALASKTVTGGVFAADPATTGTAASGDTITQIIVYVEGGSEATSPLLCLIERRSDSIPITYETDDDTITVTFYPYVMRI